MQDGTLKRCSPPFQPSLRPSSLLASTEVRETSLRSNDWKTALIASYKRCVSEGSPATSVSSPPTPRGGALGHSGEVWVEASRGGLQTLTQFKTKVVYFSSFFKTREHIWWSSFVWFCITWKNVVLQTNFTLFSFEDCAPCPRQGGGREVVLITKFSIRGGSAPLSHPLSVYVPKIPLSTFYWQMVPLSHT